MDAAAGDGEDRGGTADGPAAGNGDGPGTAVLHLDVDAFFAQAEVLRRPGLAGRPVAVAGEGRSAVVAAASYEARRAGVAAAMPVAAARRRCPGLVVVPPDHAWYRELSWQVAAAGAAAGGAVERVGLDEVYVQLHVDDPGRLDGRAAHAARRDLRRRCGLVASAGVGPTREVAKLASAAAKPDGVRVVRPGEVAAFLAGRDLADVPGVGPRTLAVLRRAGLGDVAAVAAAGEEALAGLLGGAAGAALWATTARGGATGVRPRAGQATLGHSATFPADTCSRDRFGAQLAAVADEALARLRAAGLGASGVVVRARSGGFVDVSRSRALPAPVSDRDAVQAAVAGCADELWRACRGQVRQCGVTFTGLDRSVQLVLGQGPAVLHEPPPGPGHAVVHAVFGAGTVVASDPSTAVVRFADRVRVIDAPGRHLSPG